MATMTTQAKTHTVHVDILMDVLRILFDNEIPFNVDGINEHEHTLLIRTATNPSLPKHKKVLENIEVLRSDYAYYRTGCDKDMPGIDFDNHK